jgi:hypothetical protein
MNIPGLSRRSRPQNIIDFGTAYKPTPHLQLDFHCGFDLWAATPDHSIGFDHLYVSR